MSQFFWMPYRIFFYSPHSAFTSCCVIFFPPFYLLQVFALEVQQVVLRGARCTFFHPVRTCVEPGGARRGPGQFHCPDTFLSMKDMEYRGVLGKGRATFKLESLCLCGCRKHRLHCPVPWGATGQPNAPVWNLNPRARRLSPPSPRFYRNSACATHTGVHFHSLKENHWRV